MSIPARLIFSAGLALFLGACAATVQTRIEPPGRVLRRAPLGKWMHAASRARLALPKDLDPAERLLLMAAGDNARGLTDAALLALREGDGLRKRSPAKAAGFFLASVELAWRGIEASGAAPRDWLANAEARECVAIYNAALAQFLTIEADALRGARRFWTPLGERVVSVEAQAAGRPFDRLVAAGAIEATGFRHRALVDGLGSPMVGVRGNGGIPFYTKRGTFSPVTAVARIGPRDRIDIELLDTKHALSVAVPGGTVPLAADFTAPLALAMDRLNDLSLGISGLLRISARLDTAGIYMVEPYDPDRIPVVMIHGLSSSPLIWRDMVNDLSLDPAIREKYQFWLVYYPSGMPIPQSAALIRSRLEAVAGCFHPERNCRAVRDLVVVGHSMGGVISRALATEVGDRFWRELSDKPFDSLKLPEADREKLRDYIFWKPVPGLERGIFIAAPHRGSKLADSSLAGLAMRLVRLPMSLLDLQMRFLAASRGVLKDGILHQRVLTGVGSLSPESPLYKALDASPFEEGFRYDSIMGDRGRGGTPDSSDGIVAYWSSHLDGADSELIVPTGHEAFKHPNAVERVREILSANLEEVAAGN